jgi:hypothetical protein
MTLSHAGRVNLAVFDVEWDDRITPDLCECLVCDTRPPLRYVTTYARQCPRCHRLYWVGLARPTRGGAPVARPAAPMPRRPDPPDPDA